MERSRLRQSHSLQEDFADLRLLIVVEEAHLWTARELPKAALRFLDSAVRLLRKRGVGMMLVSQKISDFDPAMRSSMNVGIHFRTKYEGDLRTIGRMLGTEMSTLVPKLPVGCSVFHLADVGDPFVTAGRLIPINALGEELPNCLSSFCDSKEWLGQSFDETP